MEPSIPSLPRAARRRLMRVVHKTRDKDHARRALAILRLAEGLAVSEVARSPQPVTSARRAPPSTAGGDASRPKGSGDWSPLPPGARLGP